MSSALLYLPCLPNINWLQNFVNYDTILIEREENFVKSSYRNRYEIGGANGRQMLTIPLQGGRDQHRLYKETKIANTGNWQKKHWQAILTAYGSSPFFEYYAYRFETVFEQPAEYLFEFNLRLLETAISALKIKWQPEFTTQYNKKLTDVVDLRYDIAGNTPVYYQVFAERTGFIPNLCVLDLLFNEGSRAITYLNH